MPQEHVLRVPVSGSNDSSSANGHVLIHVSGSNDQALEMDLLGTEASHVYKTSVRKSRVKQLRAKAFTGTDDEWLAVLSKIFFGKKPDPEFYEAVRQIDVVANLQEGKELTLVLRRMVSGIAQRLGTISLACDDGQDIELFDWAAVAASSIVEAQAVAEELQMRYNAQRETIEQLNAQLKNLIQAKQEQDTDMLSKFKQLLNSKKAKIRDQARLLSTAQVDKRTASDIRNAREANPAPKPARSSTRARKRRASTTPDDVDEAEDGEVGFADEDTKLGEPEGDETVERAETPDKSDAEPTDDEEDAFEEVPPPSHTKHFTRSSQPDGSNQVSSKEPDPPPPRRDLPFSHKASSHPASPPAAKAINNTNDDDDEDTDDEL